jgi:hypothetical protein
VPQQKASPSFADDLAALEQSSFADDLAALGQSEQGDPFPHAAVGEKVVNAVRSLFTAPPLDTNELRARQQQMGDKHPLQEGAEQAAGVLAGPYIAKAGSAVVNKVGSAVGNRAVPLVRSALKPVWAQVRKRANVEGVMPSAVANSQARFIVNHQLRTPEQADAMVKALGQQIDESNAAVSEPLDLPERVPRYIGKLLRRAKGQVLPRADRVAIENTAREVLEESPISHTVTEKVTKEVPSQILDDTGRPFVRQVEEEVKKRAIRPDVSASEGMQIARDTSAMSTGKSWGTDPGSVGAKAGEKTLERAVRDGVKHVNPDARPLLRAQGRAMDARTLLDRALWRDANRDAIGMGGIAGIANGRPTIGALLQLIKEKQLEAGLAAGRWGPRISRNAAPSGEAVQMALRAMASAMNSPTAPPE